MPSSAPALSVPFHELLAAAFPSVPARELERLSSLSTLVSLPRGARVFSHGDWAREVVWVLQGDLEVRRDGELVARLSAGSPAGELAVLDEEGALHVSRRTADVVVARDAVLLVASSRELASVLEGCPQLAALLAERAAGRREGAAAS